MNTQLLRKARELQAEIRYKILTLTDSKPAPCTKFQRHSDMHTSCVVYQAQTKCQSAKSSHHSKQTLDCKCRQITD